MFRIDGISGIEFCEVDELVNDAVMEQLGFKKVQVFGRSYIYGKNITAYYYKEGCSYVYVECFFVKLNAYTKLIIDKEKFEALGMKDKAVFLNTGKGNGSRAVPSVRYNGKTFAIHKCGHEGKEVDHTQMSLNIITEESLRECSTKQNNKNKKNLHKWGMTWENKFYICIEENNDILSESDINGLKQSGFSVKETKRSVKIEKEFLNELDAIKALRNYEVTYYDQYAFNPLNDMRGHFEVKFDQLILGTKTEEDVIKEVLIDYANDAGLIARYNLEKEYQSRGIQYNTGKTLENGQFVS